MNQDLAYCLYGDRAVFLDSTANRYFCLSPALNAAFVRRFIDGETIGDEIQDRLLRLGISQDRLLGESNDVVPKADDQLAPLYPPAQIFAAGLTHRQMQSRLRRWRFTDILSHERARQPSAKTPEGHFALARLHAAFIRASLWLGETDECLPRSLAFRILAFRRGYRPVLVIGVKLDPFAAHCWVQTDKRIDNDTLERTRLYTPILLL